jgi:hypothetical protein
VEPNARQAEALMPGRRERIPRWATELAILLVIVIAIVLVLRGDGESGFWADKPMLASLVSDLIVLILAGTAIERLLRTREELAWRGIAGLACNTIADDVSRGVSATLCVLWKDATYTPPPADEPDGGRSDSLLPEWEVRELPDGRDDVAVLRQPAAESAGAAGTLPPGRLAVLMADPDWRRWAARHLRELHSSSRPALAEWAAVMLRTPGPRDLLDRAALIVDHVGHLREDIKDAAVEPEELERRWIALDVQARLLTNALWDEAGEADTRFELPDDPEDERYWLWRDPKQRTGPVDHTKAGAKALVR